MDIVPPTAPAPLPQPEPLRQLSDIYHTHCHWMKRALALAAKAGEAGEVPVGAVIVANQQIIAAAANRRERDQDPTAHAEILALRAAGMQRQNWRLADCTLYVTLEPCPMCAGSLVLARLGQLVYGADDPKAGAVRSVLNLLDGPSSNHHLPVLPGILETACRDQLQQWFSCRRHATPTNCPPPTQRPEENPLGLNHA